MIKKISVLLMILVMVTGCSNTKIVEKDKEQSAIPEVIDVVETPEIEKVNTAEPEVIDPKEKIDLSLKPNESGKIMVLMYHNIGEEEKEWVRTTENFRKDLLTLYEKGYRPISLRDYVSGNITTPQGYTPIVLTFDDGMKNNFEYLEDGTIDENSAVGIMLDFNKEYPDFNLAATFFLNDQVLFGQSDRVEDKFQFLLENGMDIGNHSRTHANFTKISGEELQKEIGAQAEYLEGFIKQEGYVVNTMALPFGSRPKDDSLTGFLREGIYEGKKYENIAILNVGWNPAHSPYDTRFSFESIPRIRASEMKVDNVGMYNYIQYFDNNPSERFISDGVAEIITVPKDKVELITTDSDKEIYVYE